MPRTPCNGIPIYYKLTRGTRHHPIIFLHGITMSSAVWQCAQRSLTKKGFTTLALDFPGHGKSGTSDNPSTFTFESLADIVYCLAEKLHLRDPIIVGWSLGGFVAQVYAIRYPLYKLVLADTGPQGDATPDFPWAIAKKTADRVVCLLTEGRMAEMATFVQALDINETCPQVEFLKEIFTKITLQSNRQAVLDSFRVNGTRNLSANLPNIHVPVMIFAGTKDLFYPVQAQEYMLNRLYDAYMVQAPGKGHSAPFTDSGLFIRSVYRFATGKDERCDVCNIVL